MDRHVERHTRKHEEGQGQKLLLPIAMCHIRRETRGIMCENVPDQNMRNDTLCKARSKADWMSRFFAGWMKLTKSQMQGIQDPSKMYDMRSVLP